MAASTRTLGAGACGGKRRRDVWSRASEDPAQSYKITILNSPAINAFALPGGYLYVTRGLLALANDTSELAAVLAHEMAHVTSNHAIPASAAGRSA
ncbi:M48 family metalloprotease [uncultured Roseibium sp.]|uniref:M48 family metalloprotease n=1 Tax=uncultured Roseibium sp. TaxID=1936171 RepID=UPI0032172356